MPKNPVKPSQRSKTMWVNLIVAITPLLPVEWQGFIMEHSEGFVAGLGVLNMALYELTKKRYKMYVDDVESTDKVSG